VTWRVGSARIFRWTSSLLGYPRMLVLLARGWEIEAVGERYYSVLLSRPETPDSITEVS